MLKILSASASKSILHPEKRADIEYTYQDGGDEEFENLEGDPEGPESDEKLLMG